MTDRRADLSYDLRADIIAELYPRDAVGSTPRCPLLNSILAEALDEGDLESAVAIIARYRGDLHDDLVESYRRASEILRQIEEDLRLDPSVCN